MVQFISKNSKRRYGFGSIQTPQLQDQKTAEATIPMIQPNGTIKYAKPEDFQWMIDNGIIESNALGQEKFGRS